MLISICELRKVIKSILLEDLGKIENIKNSENYKELNKKDF